MTAPAVAHWMTRRATITPRRRAIVTDDVVMDFATLDQRAGQLAGYLSSEGVERGDRVCYLGDNHPAVIELLVATNRLGATLTPLSSRLVASEVAIILRDCEPKLVFVGTAFLDVVASAIGGRPSPTVVEVGGDDDTDYELVVRSGHPIPAMDHDPSGVALLMYTSGTTGNPKGALITNENLWWSMQNEVASGALGADEQTLAVAPLFHMAGLNVTVLPTLFLGGTVHVMRRFDPETVLVKIAEERITSAFMVPTMLEGCVNSVGFGDTDLTSLRMLQSGGANLPRHVAEAWIDRGVRIQQGYGMTEASPSALLLEPEDVPGKPGSVGKPRLFTDVVVVDADGSPAPPGEEGELVIRGGNVSPGYWRRPADKDRIRYGLRTRDVGRVDEDGFLYVLGRADEMFISGGENVYPDDVEAVLRDAPGVAECAVFGVPDARWGSVGRALVVPSPDAGDLDLDALRTYMRENIAAYKVPATFAVVELLPRTPTGKVKRRKLANEHV